MEQWITVLTKVAKPLLTSIVYTGINTWVEALQEEITEQHKQQAKNTFRSLTGQDRPLAETSRVTRPLLTTPDASQGLNIDGSAQRRGWPLRLSAQTLLKKAATDNKNLLFLLVPPTKPFPEFSEFEFTPAEFEQKLSQDLREFIQKNYSPHVSNKGIEFMGGLWDHTHFYGETSIQLLFEQLNAIACLLLATEIQGEEIKFNLVYWKKQARNYHCATIFTCNYQTFLRESANTRVREWKNTRNQLLQLGKLPEDLQRLGGICEENYALVEELEAIAAAGIKTEILNATYQFDDQDYHALCQFLSICHCLLVGWLADIHYLINENIPPHLPTWLLSLEKALPWLLPQPSILAVTISLYEDILTVLGQESADNIPELALKLAESLKHLPDKRWVIDPLIYSFTQWREEKQLPDTPSLETLTDIRPTLSQRDRTYLNHLKQCFVNLPENTEINQIQKTVEVLTQPPPNLLLHVPQLSQFQRQRTVTTIAEKVLAVNVEKEGYQIISQKVQRGLKLWYFDPKQGILSLRHQFGNHHAHHLAVTCSQDQQFLASSEITKERSYIKIWQLSTGKIYRTLLGHRKPIQALAIHTGNRPFIASGSHKIKLWDLQTGDPWLTLFGHKEAVSCLAMSSDGQTLISGSQDSTLRLWNLNRGELHRTLTGHQDAINTVIVYEPEAIIISASQDKTINLWDLKTGKRRQTLIGHTGGVTTLRLSYPYLLSGDETGQIYLWELSSGKLVHTLTAHQHTVQAITLSFQEKQLVSGCLGGEIQLWQTF